MLQPQNTTVDHQQLSNFIWQIADLLRGPYRPPQYERVMLPMTVLRRFDCILAPTKQDVLDKYQQCKDRFKDDALDSMLNKAAGQRFHNRSEFTFEKLKGDPNNIDKHLVTYINSFSKNIREIFERFEFTAEIEKMNEANILYLVVSKFCDVNLHPNQVDNIAMGSIFEDLIRRFNELANETAGDHFTPREVIRLMVDILFDPDDDILTKPVICRLLDPACGTGGMLSEAQNYLREHNKEAQLWVFGQDFNPRAYAIAASDFLMKGNEQSAIRLGDSLTSDQYSGATFDYFLANPPFGVNWKKQQKEVKREHQNLGFDGRFGAGLPKVNDGSLLFLQHQISKFEPYQPDSNKKGSRLAIVFNDSPLFTGGAGSGESEIRKWIIESDWLESIIALPEQMFYKTDSQTYIWIVTNRKPKHRQGKIQLIDAEHGFVVQEYRNFVETETSKIFDNQEFGYHRVTIERPLRLLYQMDVDRKSRFLDGVPHLLYDVQAIDQQLGREPRLDWNEVEQLIKDLLKQRSSQWKKAEHKLFRDVFTERDPEAEPVILKERKATGETNARVWGWFAVPGQNQERMYEADSKLRDFENVNLQDEVTRYFLEEVAPHVPDAWADRSKIKRGYEINFQRYFYKYNPPRPLAEIDADIKRMEQEIIRLVRDVTA